jgi:histidine ammonia-lyase
MHASAIITASTSGHTLQDAYDISFKPKIPGSPDKRVNELPSQVGCEANCHAKANYD